MENGKNELTIFYQSSILRNNCDLKIIVFSQVLACGY